MDETDALLPIASENNTSKSDTFDSGLFSSGASRVRPSPDRLDTGDEDLFASTNKSKTVRDPLDDESDIFDASKTEKKVSSNTIHVFDASPNTEDDIFANDSIKPGPPPLHDDEDDIFADASVNGKKSNYFDYARPL